MARLDDQYKAYLREYKLRQKKGYTLKEVYSKKEFADLQKQMKKQRMDGSVKEIIDRQSVKLTAAERMATKKALQSLEKEWSNVRYEEMSADAASSLNQYFNMTKKQQEQFLRDPNSEVWRAWVFESFGSFGYYFTLNSPK